MLLLPAAVPRSRVAGTPFPALVQLGNSGGALVSWQVGSAEEARAAARAGCDFVLAQGIEAGVMCAGRSVC